MVTDIYYNPKYGKLYENMENARLCNFHFESEHGSIDHTFLLREIKSESVAGYYDAVTPYGYGGPVVQWALDKEQLIQGFEQVFRDYCHEHRIVSEFVRFHPIFKNASDFAKVYQVAYSRQTVGTNLREFDDPVQAEFAKSLRRQLRNAENMGVRCIVNYAPKDLSQFKKLYEHTMRRNQADEFYFFPEAYYAYLIEHLREYILELQLEYEGEIIASELYFVQGELMHAHLLGSTEKMLELNAGVMLEATAARWGKERGYTYIHHGGGRSGADDDPLFLYKMKYGRHTQFEFYLGKKVWNPEIYDILVKEREKRLNHSIDDNYFPKYRAK